MSLSLDFPDTSMRPSPGLQAYLKGKSSRYMVIPLTYNIVTQYSIDIYYYVFKYIDR